MLGKATLPYFLQIRRRKNKGAYAEGWEKLLRSRARAGVFQGAFLLLVRERTEQESIKTDPMLC